MLCISFVSKSVLDFWPHGSNFCMTAYKKLCVKKLFAKVSTVQAEVICSAVIMMYMGMSR